MKRTEAALRVAAGYKHKLSPNITILIQSLHGNNNTVSMLITALQDENFDKIIDETVSECYRMFMNDANFSEENIISPLSQYYKQLIQTELYTIFCQMRKIKLNNDSTKQFFEQAKLMENLTDNFSETMTKENHASIYAKMTNDELRSYFTWRTNIRAGECKATSIANIRLYSYELVNDIGILDKDDAIKQMINIALHYGTSIHGIKKFMVTLIKDYYLYNSFNMDFVEFAKKYQIEPYFPNILLSLGFPCCQCCGLG